MIAVTESVNNAIVHGNQKASNKNVSLKLNVDESMLRFTIRDEGPGFNYNNLPDPTSPENLDKPGGRGIFLMKNLCDEVHFEDEGRAVSLVFYLN
jgi:serine/threonine-protein kinase RsbW